MSSAGDGDDALWGRALQPTSPSQSATPTNSEATKARLLRRGVAPSRLPVHQVRDPGTPDPRAAGPRGPEGQAFGPARAVSNKLTLQGACSPWPTVA